MHDFASISDRPGGRRRMRSMGLSIVCFETPSEMRRLSLSTQNFHVNFLVSWTGILRDARSSCVSSFGGVIQPSTPFQFHERAVVLLMLVTWPLSVPPPG